MTDQAAQSRRMVRAHWVSGASDEDARGYLQTRLTMLFKLMFWSIAALLGLLLLMYGSYPEIEPRYNTFVYLLFGGGLATMGVLWRGLLIRRKLTLSQLHGIDLIYCVGTNGVIATCSVIAYDFRVAGYVCVLYSCFTLLTRALIVPSTGARTATLTTLAIVPMVGAAIALAVIGTQEVPGPGFVVGYLQLGLVCILLSAAGSRIIYGLRRQVSVAQQLGQYTLVRKIGEGGMGVVYLAHHIMLRRPTAVKLLLPDRVGANNLARFEREVQHMSELTHPNTVAVYDYGRSPDGIFYYAMEYLGGGIDLENLIKKHGPQPEGRVIQILSQICGALQEAHELGVIHRDIKPANIILCQRGAMPDVAKLVDFGLVKQITADTGASTQVILGTPAYLSPEAITDPGSIGPAADQYALGAVGYFLLAGRRVFEGKTAVDVCIQHVTATPKPLSDIVPPISIALEALIMQCLRKNPLERHASTAILARALEALAIPEGWDEEAARRWWREFTPMNEVVVASANTITVDLGQRESGRRLG